MATVEQKVKDFHSKVKNHSKKIVIHLRKHHRKYIFWILSAALLWKWIGLITTYLVVHNLSFSFADTINTENTDGTDNNEITSTITRENWYLKFMDPVSCDESICYTTGQNISVKIFWDTGYTRELSGDIEQIVTWTFDESTDTGAEIRLKDWTWEKTIYYFGYNNSTSSQTRVIQNDYTITLMEEEGEDEGGEEGNVEEGWEEEGEWEEGGTVEEETASGSVSCGWDLGDNEISVWESAIFILTYTWSDSLTWDFSWNVSVSGINNYELFMERSMNGSTWKNKVKLTWNQTGDVQLVLSGGVICLEDNSSICNDEVASNTLTITSSNTNGQEYTAPEITIAWPEPGWSTGKTVSATATNADIMYYATWESRICDSWSMFRYTSGSSLTFDSEEDNNTYVSFFAENNGWLTGCNSVVVKKIDTTAPVLSWRTEFGSGWYNTDQTSIFTYRDTGALISGNTTTSCTITAEWEGKTCTVESPNICDNAWNCNNESVTSDSIKLDKTAPTCTITQNPTDTTNWAVTLTLSYLVESNPIENWFSRSGTTYSSTNTMAVSQNGTYRGYVKDIAWNTGSCNKTVSNISTWNHSSPWDLVWLWVHTVYSNWTISNTVDFIWYNWATGGYNFTNDTGSIDWTELWYIPVTSGSISLSITWEDHNWKYICAFGTTGWYKQTICTDYPIKIDITFPELSLLTPSSSTTFDSGHSVTFSWSGHDGQSWISGYTLKLTKPDNSTETFVYDPWTTYKSYTLTQSGTRNWSVTVTDNLSHSTTKTGSFVVNYTGSNESESGSVDTGSGFYLISPALWDQLYLWNYVELKRNHGETNSWYVWNVFDINGNTVSSGSTTGNTVTLSSWLFSTWVYSRSVENLATDEIEFIPLFYIVKSGNIPDLKVDQFEFDEIEDSELTRYHESNKININGLSDDWYTLAYLWSGIWVLFINGNFVWTSGYVHNWDKIRIEMISSDEYNTTVKSTLFVWAKANTVSWDFKITTKDWISGWDDSSLTPIQKLWWIVFIDNLVEMYKYDENKLATFLSTFMQILQDKSDWYGSEIEVAEDEWDDELANEYKLYKEAVDFLYVMVKYRYDNLEIDDYSVYIAPNGKQYIVEYDYDRMAYTSPDFARAKYFPTWELFTNHIDLNNPEVWSWWIVWNVITTHNGKVYTIYETNGKWTSSNFKTAKYFDTKEDIINHILANNPASDRDHKIDTDFDEVKYTAPNGKIYKIFKTSSKWNNPNMYSSYNFVDAKYFTSLEAAKKFINQNNKK